MHGSQPCHTGSNPVRAIIVLKMVGAGEAIAFLSIIWSDSLQTVKKSLKMRLPHSLRSFAMTYSGMRLPRSFHSLAMTTFWSTRLPASRFNLLFLIFDI